ncbi:MULTISPECIES: DNA/RNA nuclease SfsA [Caproicibacterium]|jgi:sugar fermentation stimulation protein A|uniref:DNA/RNA nuclease SfsA n=1 Tax=Caproicibacterium argilliputei TaxID=3030016 RepID=A0AA97H3B3_9FIRM|nr:DNA/RNA nuclease SfsA [Caproicibacterium argilliputei]MDD3230317.1 DNA/RNA nuclease SfsA [Oscillospiraceae bacterium]MDD4509790.1 DNA/RNA nuclease SfsA [Oscillospiraceae bacterium]WOC32088.1 DNA/RNA nuclease SfsA [Caproicibacterium argilliputei]
MKNGLQKAFAEVKGVTLEENGAVLFPDAPTKRGVKHIHGLCRATEDSYLAFLVFVIQMKNVRYLSQKRRTHPAFGTAMEDARKYGVTLLAFDCCASPDEIWLDQPINIVL